MNGSVQYAAEAAPARPGDGLQSRRTALLALSR